MTGSSELYSQLVKVSEDECISVIRNIDRKYMNICIKVKWNVIISLRHSVNGDFCDHSRFVLWHENLTTFVS